MGPLMNGLSAGTRIRRFSAAIASLLIALVAIPPSVFADARPLEPGAVHERIVKRGVGRSINVEERTGVILTGTITAIGADSFSLRVKDDSTPVVVKYLDVADFPRGGMHGRTIFMLAGIGGVAAFAIWGFVHVHDLNEEHQLPTLSNSPAAP
ncbi:MAG: hypothetical protein WBD46_03275 [Acidobacteriaceae bacterium]